MANYIDQEILCEAYTHLNIDLFDDKVALAKLRNHLLPFFEERAKFLLGEDVEVRIEFEPGSLKTRLQVLGSAGAILLGGVAGYGSFRESIDHLSRDAATLAQSANLEVLFRTQTAYCDRVNIEKRKGVFGRVDDLLSQFDSIKTGLSGDRLPMNVRALSHINSEIDRLIDWNTRAEKLFEKLTNADTEGCIATGLMEELEKLPDDLLWAAEVESRSFRATMAKSDPELAGHLAAVVARYRASVKGMKKSMMKRIAKTAPTGRA